MKNGPELRIELARDLLRKAQEALDPLTTPNTVERPLCGTCSMFVDLAYENVRVAERQLSFLAPPVHNGPHVHEPRE